MAVRNRESGSNVVQVAAFTATIAVLLLGYLVFKTLGLELSGHRQRLQTMAAVSALDAEISQLFQRSARGGVAAGGSEIQQASQRLAKAVDELQDGSASLKSLSPEIDAALNRYLDTLISKLERGRSFDAKNRFVKQEADKGYLASAAVEEARQLSDFAQMPTASELAALDEAYQLWFQGRMEEGSLYRTVLAGYTAFLLLALAYLGFRLRLSYAALDQANAGLREANRTLESQVKTRTKELSSAVTNLKESQAQLIQSEKMASLGQMIAGVAHEINTPLGYARSNAEIVRTALDDIRALCESQSKALGLITSEGSDENAIAEAMAEAEARREATAAEDLMANLDSLLADTDHGLLQIADLVASLKDFSRVDRSRNDLFDLNAGVDSALKICNNQLKGRVEVVRNFTALPEIECSPSQINQVFLNLITNAAQAIADSGTITIDTAVVKDNVVVQVADTGGGMSEETRKRMFEPFFTTKPVGKGTGLGLSIVFRIIEEHGGRIDAQSELGVGTVFSVHLPLKQKAMTA